MVRPVKPKQCPQCGRQFMPQHGTERANEESRQICCSNSCGASYRWAKRTDAELIATFWQQVVKTSGCWLWQGARDPNGYGRTTAPIKNTTWLAHRFAWWATKGHLPADVDILHKCDNPPCVRLSHLFPGTHQDNMADMWRKGRGYLKLDFGAVTRIRELYRTSGATQRDLAGQFGVTQAQIWHIVNNRQRISR